MKRVDILTSSRADYGIYRPLLRHLHQDVDVELRMMVFGTHLSPLHGFTIDDIIGDGYSIKARLDTVPSGDTAAHINEAMARTMKVFGDFWENKTVRPDLLIALGDRYEMMSAVLASHNFGVNIAHLHGGETTLGARDNTYRHTITLCSQIHFCSTSQYSDRIADIIGSRDDIHNVGALGLDNLNCMNLYTQEELLEIYNIDFSIPTIMCTYHPETVDYQKNEQKLDQLCLAIHQLSSEYQVVLNYPNADITGDTARSVLTQLADSHQNIQSVEHFGTRGFFSALRQAILYIGNSSSGIIEAASLGTYVANIGDRQKGRIQSDNTIDVPFDSKSIVDMAHRIILKGRYTGGNVYQYKDGSSADAIHDIIKKALFER